MDPVVDLNGTMSFCCKRGGTLIGFVESEIEGVSLGSTVVIYRVATRKDELLSTTMVDIAESSRVVQS